jgi:hypothetical protein
LDVRAMLQAALSGAEASAPRAAGWGATAGWGPASEQGTPGSELAGGKMMAAAAALLPVWAGRTKALPIGGRPGATLCQEVARAVLAESSPAAVRRCGAGGWRAQQPEARPQGGPMPATASGAALQAQEGERALPLAGQAGVPVAQDDGARPSSAVQWARARAGSLGSSGAAGPGPAAATAWEENEEEEGKEDKLAAEGGWGGTALSGALWPAQWQPISAPQGALAPPATVAPARVLGKQPASGCASTRRRTTSSGAASGAGGTSSAVLQALEALNQRLECQWALASSADEGGGAGAVADAGAGLAPPRS